MKKVFLSICFVFASSYMYAKEIGIPQIPRVIVLIPHVLDEDSQTPQHPKSPQATIRITQNGCTLSFPQPFSLDILVELRDANGNVVYSDVLLAGSTTLSLPSSLSGDYTLLLYLGDFCYGGDIHL